MKTEDPASLREIWRQDRVPVIYRPQSRDPVLVKLPYAEDNRVWLLDGDRWRIRWVSHFKCWQIPRIRFNRTVDLCLMRYGKVHVIQSYREQEKCAPACWNAKGHVCQCSCLGANHGKGAGHGWFVVGDTFATRWGDKKLACRTLVINEGA